MPRTRAQNAIVFDTPLYWLSNRVIISGPVPVCPPVDGDECPACSGQRLHVQASDVALCLSRIGRNSRLRPKIARLGALRTLPRAHVATDALIAPRAGRHLARAPRPLKIDSKLRPYVAMRTLRLQHAAHKWSEAIKARTAIYSRRVTRQSLCVPCKYDRS